MMSLGQHGRELLRQVEQCNADGRMKLLLAGEQASSGAGSTSAPRTMAQPDYSDSGNDKPLDVVEEKPPMATLSKEEFEAQVVWLAFNAEKHQSLRPYAACPAILDSKVRVVLSESDQLWLQCMSDEAVGLNAGELFGYGLGSFTPQPTGLKVLPASTFHLR